MLTDTSIEIVLRMLCLALININVEFTELGKLIWRLYIDMQALLSTSWVQLIDKKKFARTTLDQNSEPFLVYVSALEIMTIIPIYSFRALYMQDNPTLATLQ